MESGTLPPPTMLMHPNDSMQQISSSDSPMNPFSDIYSSRQPINNKPNKRKLEEIVDPSSTDFESSSSLKPQKTEQTDSERSLSRTGTPVSNGPLQSPSSLTPSRNNNDNGLSYDFGPPSNNNNNNTGSTTPNSSLLPQQTPPPPSLQQSQQQQQALHPPPPSSYMPMSPRNQYTITSDSPFIQTNNQVFVFTTQLANEAAESVLKNEYPNIIEYHKSLPSTAQYLSSLSNNMNNSHNSLLGGPMHMNHGQPPPPPGCHSPRTMQMMMGGPVPHNPHLPPHNGNGGPPPNWPHSHPHFHPHQQQPPFGRLTPGSGGLPPPSHLLPPGALMLNGQPPSDGIENLTPERAKHRKNQLNKIEDLKTKITGGRNRGGRGKANNAAAAAAAAAAATAAGNIPPPVNGGSLPPGSLDPHQQQMMMMNSPRGVGPPHHMMGMGLPPQSHMLPPGMRAPDGMMLDMNGPPPHGYMNGPMPPNFPGQYGMGPGDPYGQLPPPHQQAQAVRDWNKMQMDHMGEKAQQMRGQPPPYASASPSSLTPPIATTSAGSGIGPNGKLLSPKLEPSTAPRLYKVGQPEKFIPDQLPSSVNKKLTGNVGEVQLTASPTQMDYNEIGMEGEELIITRHLNRGFRPSNGVNSGAPLPSSSSSCKDEPLTPSGRSNSTPNTNGNPLSAGPPQPVGSTTPTHLSQGPPSHLGTQGVSAVSPRSAKLPANSSLSSPLMLSNNSSAKDEPLDMNNGPKTPTSNMAPPLSSMLQMTNNLQSANSPYNPSSNSGSKPPSLSSNLSGNGPPLSNPPMPHMTKLMDHLPPPSHMSLPPPHQQQQQQHMQFQNMNPHHRMLGPPESMPPHYNPHHGGNLPPPPHPHPHMYKMMPPHHALDQSGTMMPHPGGPSRSSKGLPPPSDPMQQHHLPPPHYMKMHNMDPLLGPPPGHQQQHMRFVPMMDDGYCMGPPPPPPPPSHHPHMHPHMHSHPQMHPHPMHPNDGRPPPPQAINNTYVSTTMSIQQLNIQSLGPNGPPPELQPGTIHYHASSGNGPDSQQQGLSVTNGNGTMFASQQQFTTMNSMPSNDPSFPSQYNDLQLPPSNLSVDGVQQPPYW